MLVAPTNIAFGGPELKSLIIASLCGWAVHTAPMPVAGLPVRYPKVEGRDLPRPAYGDKNRS